MRRDFLSMNDIRRQSPGFKFYQKDNLSLFELVSVKEEWVCVAHGFLGDAHQKMITIEAINKNGKTYRENNLTNKLNGGNIYTIAYIEKDWDELRFRTYESVQKERRNRRLKLEKKTKEIEKENRDNYLKFLRESHERGDITDKQLQDELIKMVSTS